MDKIELLRKNWSKLTNSEIAILKSIGVEKENGKPKTEVMSEDNL